MIMSEEENLSSNRSDIRQEIDNIRDLLKDLFEMYCSDNLSAEETDIVLEEIEKLKIFMEKLRDAALNKMNEEE